MRERTLLLYAAAAVGIAGLSLIAAAGQSSVPAKKATTAAIRRLADGHPDLQGTYDLATLTPVGRRAGADARRARTPQHQRLLAATHVRSGRSRGRPWL